MISRLTLPASLAHIDDMRRQARIARIAARTMTAFLGKHATSNDSAPLTCCRLAAGSTGLDELVRRHATRLPPNHRDKRFACGRDQPTAIATGTARVLPIRPRRASWEEGTWMSKLKV